MAYQPNYSRTDLAVARIAPWIVGVPVAAWFWFMVPILAPSIMAGGFWSAALLGLPPFAAFVYTDRIIALRLKRPRSAWSRTQRSTEESP